MVVDIGLEPTLVAGTPRYLFEKGYYSTSTFEEYDVAPDGQRFLFIEPVEKFESKQIRIVFNWFEELERLVPTN